MADAEWDSGLFKRNQPRTIADFVLVVPRRSCAGILRKDGAKTKGEHRRLLKSQTSAKGGGGAGEARFMEGWVHLNEPRDG